MPDSAAVAASLARAARGQGPVDPRAIQFHAAGHHIALRFVFDGEAGEGEEEFMNIVGAEVAADFPDTTVSEEAIPCATRDEIVCPDGWRTAFLRQQPPPLP